MFVVLTTLGLLASVNAVNYTNTSENGTTSPSGNASGNGSTWFEDNRTNTSGNDTWYNPTWNATTNDTSDNVTISEPGHNYTNNATSGNGTVDQPGSNSTNNATSSTNDPPQTTTNTSHTGTNTSHTGTNTSHTGTNTSHTETNTSHTETNTSHTGTGMSGNDTHHSSSSGGHDHMDMGDCGAAEYKAMPGVTPEERTGHSFSMAHCMACDCDTDFTEDNSADCHGDLGQCDCVQLPSGESFEDAWRCLVADTGPTGGAAHVLPLTVPALLALAVVFV